MSEKKFKQLRRKLRELYKEPRLYRYAYKLAKRTLRNA